MDVSIKFSPLTSSRADGSAQVACDNSQIDHDTDDSIRYSIFCVVWAIATLFHMAQSRIFTNELHFALLTVAAVAVMLKPSSVVRLVLLIALQLYEVLLRLPEISNHWIFTTFVNLTILQALLYVIVKNRSLHVSRGQLIRTFAPVVRVELLLLYLFVVLHKLNWGFFSTDFSCAAVLYKAQNVEALLPASPTFLLFNIYLTIIVETLIPVLLFFRKTRNAGLLIGLVFHCVIAFNSYNGFYDFSGMIFAAYFLFSGYSFSNTIYAFYRKLPSLRSRLKQRFTQLTALNVAVLLAVLLGSFALLTVLTKRFDDYFRLVWGAYSFLFILLFLLSLTRGSDKQPERTFALPALVFLLFPVLVFLNGMSPYLGLKTESSFAMFSNLRTEGGITNHFFIPASAQVFGYQKDMVEVVSSSDPKLQKVATEGKLLPYFMFKNHVAADRPAQVVYIRKGEQRVFNLASATSDDDLLRKSSFLLRKLLGFRAITKTEPQPCQH
ncbi:hypothetical protein [Hymenobacter sp. B1770]|uniref:hypothetical protein n=1 Tax=Hymenobacter sp. B1770 TaxID=1718788 RepID=UPI003CF51A46